MKDEREEAASDLHREIAAARQETQRLEAERQRFFLGELQAHAPLARLERAAWLMRHEQADGPFGLSMPLADVDLAHVQQEALEHVRQAIQDLDDPAERLVCVRGVLLDLDLMHDYDGIVRAVREKVARILEHLQDQRRQPGSSHQGMSRAEEEPAVDPAVQALHRDQRAPEHLPEPAAGTATTWQHLARALAILTCYPDLYSKKAFEEKALLLQERLGPPGEDPGSTIWRGVQRLAQKRLDTAQMPSAYQHFAGFRRLVFDLLHGKFTVQDNHGTRKPPQDNLPDKI